MKGEMEGREERKRGRVKGGKEREMMGEEDRL